MKTGPYRIPGLLLITCWPWLAGAAQAAEGPACPSGLAVTQTVSDLPAGWTASDLNAGAAHRLLSAGLSEGPPEELRMLKPGRTVGQAGAARFVQLFMWTKAPSHPVHLFCRYAGTTVVVHQAVGFDPRQCDLETTRAPDGRNTALLRCR